METNNEEFITYQNFKMVCRVCLKKIDTDEQFLFDAKHYEDNVFTYAEILNFFSAVKIELNDDLPHNICRECAKLADVFVWFKQTCDNSNKKLQEILKQHEEFMKIVADDITDHNNDQNGGSTIEEEVIYSDNDITIEYNQEYLKIKEENIEVDNETKENSDTLIHKSDNDKYSCTHCEKIFQKARLLKAHIERIHSGTKNYKCEKCNRTFNVRGNLKRHELIHTGIKPHKCRECPAAFIQLVQLQDHIRRHHTFEKPYACMECNKRYVKLTDLKHHLQTQNHSVKDIIENGRHICGFCKQEFDSSEQLMAHKLTHTRYSHLCSECGRSFSSKRGLNLHQEIHKDKTVDCVFCDKNFASNAKLKMHLRIHGPRSFLCSECGKNFMTKNVLDEHMKIHSEERPFLCKVDGCGKRFKQKTSLNFHILTHTKEKKYSCNICGKRFAQTGHLYYHKRYHSGVKPFSCILCEKKFAMKASLSSHMNRHRGERPYSCEFCTQTFFDASSMNKHKKKNHPVIQS